MSEICVPEAVVVIFLALPILRPFFKALMPLDGLAWLPPIALIITVGIFPAYGFRPECLPMLAFALFVNIANAAKGIAQARYGQTFLAAVFSLVFLTAVAVPMFAFSPSAYTEPNTGPVRTVHTGTPDRDYYLRIYGTVQPEPA